MADFKNNQEAQAELKKLEAYIQSKIEADFPIKVKRLIDYDQDDDGDLVGMFEDTGARQYSFAIQKETPRPILQRI